MESSQVGPGKPTEPQLALPPGKSSREPIKALTPARRPLPVKKVQPRAIAPRPTSVPHDDHRETTAPAPSRPGQKKNKPKIRRVPGLDGLRGIAVSVVVIYHFFAHLLPGGFLGVDIFFVLSGFLITSLLVREKAVTRSVSLPQFWLRRARRILPAALFVLITMTAIGGFFGGDAAVGLPRQFFSSALFANNWGQIIASRSYFAESGAELFAHYWSLAVEEQFYLLWPLIFLFITVTARNKSRRPLVLTSLILALGSVLLMLVFYNPSEDPSRVYYGTDTHAFGLLIGAALALSLSSNSADPDADSWPIPGPRRHAGLRGLAALVVLAGLVVFLPDQSPWTYRGGLLLASLATAVVVFSVVRNHTIPRIIGEFRPLRYLGSISFSLYLWHWPVVVIVKEIARRFFGANTTSTTTTLVCGLLALAFSLALADWSYRVIETPIRRRGYKAVAREFFGSLIPGTRRLQWGFGVVGLAAITALALVCAPQQTQLESDLAAMSQDKGDLSQAVDATDIAEQEHREMPKGDEITAIGDSVLLASKAAMNDAFPGIYVDGEVSRHYEAAPAIISSMKAAGTLDPFVVLSFGTNGPADGAGNPQLLDQIIRSLGAERTIILVMPYGDRSYMPAAQQEVLEAAKKYPNVYVADWCHRAQADHSLLRSDLIHPDPPGAQAYADAVRAALQQWVHHDKKVPGQCGV
ncbi:acyltransferase family protein [Corynebacterium poyangense]|uniref:Acyltransferase family protein n=1 Tax=Corynebacterium poyangense TaxID=2684405 RepID=A0A7H0SPI7_9CORY|nr:acyltransferase family protein [Corynebacterium poyangense]QNQ90462.1 acyltransferase family protein [Corynebacterium poyangense]